jgi:hypothetical protein
LMKHIVTCSYSSLCVFDFGTRGAREILDAMVQPSR